MHKTIGILFIVAALVAIPVIVYAEKSKAGAAGSSGANTASTTITSMSQNNNPTSIVYDPKDFPNMVSQYNGIGVFDTLQNGVLGAEQNANAKFTEGYRILQDFANIWSNNSPGYANTLLQYVQQAPIFNGVPLSVNSDISYVSQDLNSMAWLIAGITVAEGTNPLSQQTVLNLIS